MEVFAAIIMRETEKEKRTEQNEVIKELSPLVASVHLGMVLNNMSKVTIFGHKRFFKSKCFIKVNLIFFMKKKSVAFDIGSHIF